MDFYKLSSELRNMEGVSVEISESYLNKKIEFIHVFHSKIKITEKELQRKNLTEKETMKYWSEYIQCFVKLEPLERVEDYPHFNSDIYPYALIVEIYKRENFLIKLKNHYSKWNSKL